MPALADVLGVATGIERDRLVDLGRRFALVHRGIERLAGGVHGALQMDGRKVERFADLVEALGAAVFGQERGKFLVDAEQVVQRLLELVAIQSAEHRRLVGAIGLGEARGQGLGEGG